MPRRRSFAVAITNSFKILPPRASATGDGKVINWLANASRFFWYFRYGAHLVSTTIPRAATPVHGVGRSPSPIRWAEGWCEGPSFPATVVLSRCAQTQTPPRSAPRLPVNVPVGSFTNALAFVELSEFFLCILYTEVSESWTTPFLARKVHSVRVTKNTKKHGSDLIRPTPRSKACPATCHFPGSYRLRHQSS